VRVVVAPRSVLYIVPTSLTPTIVQPGPMSLNTQAVHFPPLRRVGPTHRNPRRPTGAAGHHHGSGSGRGGHVPKAPSAHPGRRHHPPPGRHRHHPKPHRRHPRPGRHHHPRPHPTAQPTKRPTPSPTQPIRPTATPTKRPSPTPTPTTLATPVPTPTL
jgi:hypothetical protein